MGYFRLFLAMSVAVRHMGIPYTFLMRGQVAVITFFILSGFFIALVINRKYSTTRDDGWIWNFYKSRAIRIFPVYLVGLAVVVVWMMSKGHPTVYSVNLGMGYFFQAGMMIVNTFTLGSDWLMLLNVIALDREFDPHGAIMFWTISDTLRSGTYIILPLAWSLSTIFTFYLLAPYVVTSLKRTLTLGIACMALRMGIVFSPEVFTSWAWEYFFSPALMVFFCMGALSYHLYLIIKEWANARRIGIVAMGALFTFFAVSIVLQGGAFTSGEYEYHDTPQIWMYYIAVSICVPFAFIATRGWMGDRLAGELSYPMYMFHLIVLLPLYDTVPMEQPMYQALVMILMLCASYVVLVLVDRPVNAWRTGGVGMAPTEKTGRRFRVRWAVVFLAAVMLAPLVRVQAAEPTASTPVFINGNKTFRVAYHNERYYAFPRMWSFLLTKEDLKTIEDSASGSSMEEALAEAERQAQSGRPWPGTAIPPPPSAGSGASR